MSNVFLAVFLETRGCRLFIRLVIHRARRTNRFLGFVMKLNKTNDF